MPKFSDFLAIFRKEPTSFPAAVEQITAAQTQLDSVSALFASAGLPLDEMLAAGPDSLKAHLARLERENEQEIAVLTYERDTLAANLTANVAQVETLNSQLSALNSTVSAHDEILATVGFPSLDTAKDPAAIKSAFASHIERQASAILAKDGRPPIAFVPRGTEEKKPEAPNEQAALSAHFEAMAKLATPEEQRAYFVKHIRPLQK